MSGIRYDPEFLEVMAPLLNAPKPPPSKDVFEARDRSNAVLAMVLAQMPPAESVQRKDFTVAGPDGNELTLSRFSPEAALNSATPVPAVLYCHGGGYVGGSVDIYAPMIRYYAGRTDIHYFAVQYRLAPEHTAPAGIEDCYAGLSYLSQNALELNVDPAQLTVCGDSAGAGLAASVALLARDRGFSPPIWKQMLIYPMLDDRTTLPADHPVRPFLLWDPESNTDTWKTYLGDKPATENPSYAVPARAESLKGLPTAYLDIGSLDLFMDETLEYGRRLTAAGVEVELHVFPGLPHGFEAAITTSWFSRTMDARVTALKRL